jgi:hypothetical protein
MYLKPKKASLLILAITAIVCSRIIFLFINDSEGPNLLVVIGMAVILYFLSLVTYSLKLSITDNKKLFLAVLIQVMIVIGFYFFLK